MLTQQNNFLSESIWSGKTCRKYKFAKGVNVVVLILLIILVSTIPVPYSLIGGTPIQSDLVGFVLGGL